MKNNLPVARQYLNESFSVIPLYSLEMVQGNPPRKFFEELEKEIKINKSEKAPVSDAQVKEKLIIDWCKRPIVSWTEYQKRMPTKDEVQMWFESNPSANIGIVTGKVSNLVVVDLDSNDAIESFRKKGWFENAGVVKTGRGYHLYFQYPDFEIRNSTNEKFGIDIRGEGGYAVAPPSVHGSGHQYTWDSRNILTQDPGEMTPEIIEFIKFIQKKDTSKSKKPTKNNHQSKNTSPFDDSFINGCNDGERHDSGVRIAGHFFGKGLGKDEVLTIMRGWNARNKPPLADKEITQIVTNIANHEKEKTPSLNIENFLWNSERILASVQKGCRVPFAGDNLKTLEDSMSGGLIGGCIYLLGGVPSSGKTTLVNSIADNICLQDHPVLFFSYDDAPMEINNRTLARFSKHKMVAINKREITRDEILTIYQENQSLQKIIHNKYLLDDIIKVEQWPTLIEQIIKKHQKSPVIVIDYLKRLIIKKKTADERMRIDAIVGQLDGLAKKYDLPIFAISELNRDSYRAGQIINMAAFKESGGLEYSASWLGILAPFEEKRSNHKIIPDWEQAIRSNGNIDLAVLKAKRGTGNPGRIPLQIDSKKMIVYIR